MLGLLLDFLKNNLVGGTIKIEIESVLKCTVDIN